MSILFFTMNIYRLCADSIHVLSILFLMINIRLRRSSAGVSFKTQALYALVYVARYLGRYLLIHKLMIDLFWGWNSAYNVLMKIFFIISSVSILYLIKHSYKVTHDAALDTFKIEYLLLVSVLGSLVFNYGLSVSEAFTFRFVRLTVRFHGRLRSGLRALPSYLNSLSSQKPAKQKISLHITLFCFKELIAQYISSTGSIDTPTSISGTQLPSSAQSFKFVSQHGPFIVS